MQEVCGTSETSDLGESTQCGVAHCPATRAGSLRSLVSLCGVRERTADSVGSRKWLCLD
jgi:hypothetical protein